ncbi:MAG: Eco57I restriction-modification methylase domain-containing protein [Maioricimonas sp. JB049]
MLTPTAHKPDILEVIADLSNDEVRTPPWVANSVLDLLPEKVWADPSLRWLDPGAKTGVFLREITKRLMDGLRNEIPDERRRLKHILTEQVFGIAVTELTALMSRRTLYCSKRADSSYSTVQFEGSAGNIWFEQLDHPYVRGKCEECRASENQISASAHDDTYAYGFLHKAGMEKIEREYGMQFDIIVGNPPYQMESDGGSRDLPIYDKFVDIGRSLNPRYFAMIIPSRWMAGGLGLDEFRNSMLSDRRLRKLVDYAQMDQLFPGVDFEGGVCYFLWDRDTSGDCEVIFVRNNQQLGPTTRKLDEFDIFVRDDRSLSILRKVLKFSETSMENLVETNNAFGIGTNYSGYVKKRQPGTIRLHIVRKGSREVGWIKRDNLPKGFALVDRWKVLIPKSYGERGAVPAQVLGPTLISSPPSCSSQTYLLVPVDSEHEATSVESYVKTRLFRFLVSLRKITQHAPKTTYRWVPQQSWDREWTDDVLYAKYGITAEEQTYIAEMVKEMPG